MDITSYKVGLFVPCDIDQFSPQTAWNAVHLLENLGLHPYYPPELTDSGMMLYNQGDIQSAKLLGEKMIEYYEDCTHIVSLSSATVAYVQKRFPSLFHNTTLHNEYRHFIERFVDITDFLVNDIHFTPKTSFRYRVAFMDQCQTLNDYRSPSHPDVLGLRDEPRQLLSAIDGIDFVEMSHNDVCCGYGGLFANHFTVISDELARRKLESAIEAGAECVVSTEMGCLLHLRSFADKNNMPILFMHIVDVLASSL